MNVKQCAPPQEWRLGKTPEFSHQFETRIDGIGIFDVNLKARFVDLVLEGGAPQFWVVSVCCSCKFHRHST